MINHDGCYDKNNKTTYNINMHDIKNIRKKLLLLTTTSYYFFLIIYKDIFIPIFTQKKLFHLLLNKLFTIKNIYL